jgi:hypothetical protein
VLREQEKGGNNSCKGRRTEVRVILIDNVKENYSCNIIGFSPSHFSPFT